jgi:hypothetical protein
VVGSLKYGSIRVFVYSNDRFPMHVYGWSEDSVVIVELLTESVGVRLANRKHCDQAE